VSAKRAYIVTGSASGVGAAVARALARSGAAVAINYSKSAQDAERVAAECRTLGGDAIAVRCDVSQDDDCRSLAAATLDQWGRIDGLVNNAGTTKFAPMRSLDLLAAEDFQRIYAVNVIGAFQMARACEQALRAARGAIVNVSSIASTMGLGSSMAYAASKGALNTLTICLARVFGPEVRVNALLPGFIETKWLKEGLGAQAYAEAQAAYRKQSTLQSTLSPEDVADSVLMLLNANNMTGQLLTLDAGKGAGIA
jgi:NAD(P)-dependent dehydrogenase (short-subunit alcohol dehydrogenase family)